MNKNLINSPPPNPSKRNMQYVSFHLHTKKNRAYMNHHSIWINHSSRPNPPKNSPWVGVFVFCFSESGLGENPHVFFEVASMWMSSQSLGFRLGNGEAPTLNLIEKSPEIRQWRKESQEKNQDTNVAFVVFYLHGWLWYSAWLVEYGECR